MEAQNEIDFRKRQIVAGNQALPKSQPHAVFLKKGTLVVDGRVYQDRVKKFSVEQIFAPDTNLSDYASAKYATGESYEKDGSKFFGFAASAHSQAQVEAIYIGT